MQCEQHFLMRYIRMICKLLEIISRKMINGILRCLNYHLSSHKVHKKFENQIERFLLIVLFIWSQECDCVT